MPTQESRVASRSTLANLLSLQHRSAVQSARHRVQLARPFAGTAQIENAAKRAAAQLLPQPPQGKNRQGGIKIQQSSYNVSNQKPLSYSSSEPSRRVSFISRDGSIPRKKAILDEPSAQGEPTKISPNVSILRKVDRATQQKFTTKEATSFKASTTIGSTQKPGGDSKDFFPETISNAVLAAERHTDKDQAICIESQVPQNEQSSNVILDRPRDSTAKVQNVTLRRTVDDHILRPKTISVSKDKRIRMVLHETKVKSPELVKSKIESAAEIPKKKTKKKKKFSPFRAKVGCVVAIRFRKLTDGGNPNVVWLVHERNSSKPCGGGGDAKDGHETVKINNTPIIVDGANSDTAQGCTGAFAKQTSKYEVWSLPIPGKDDGLSLLGSWIRCAMPHPASKENRNAAKKSSLRALEGNVISIRDNDYSESSIKVVMLVDRKDFDTYSDLQLAADTLDDATTSSSERKKRDFEAEAQIRGKDKVAVEVTLASLSDQRRGSKLDPGVIKDWAVMKRVTAKSESQAPPCQQTGNGTDRSALESSTRESISQLIGEVVKVDVSPSSECSSTIATVTIKRLWTPEQLDGGRLPHHGLLDLYDCSSDSGNEMYFQAPIEDLIVIGTRITRIVDISNRSLLDRTLNNGSGWNFTVTHSYQRGDNSLTPLCSGKVTSCTDFILPKSVGRPSFSPNIGEKRSKSCGKETNDEQQEVKPGKIRKRHKRALSATITKPTKKLKVTLVAELTADEKGEKLINAECSRAVSFDQLPKSNWGSSKSKHASFLREKHHPRTIRIGKIEEKTALSGRAARASQRRMIKILSMLGDASKSVDRLAGRDREHQLRFDKSKVHGWGVYAEEQINGGDLIIEYRGEIIGNAVADKREKEYEKAKLDDYMFRIDAYTVCDATLLGNVARYINASCSPNCYTQIITAGENKRIVIYAKKDIQRGEELCYDYKFSLEYDPLKRIPCHCGSTDCRGFMNWVSSTQFSSNICWSRTEPDPEIFFAFPCLPE